MKKILLFITFVIGISCYGQISQKTTLIAGSGVTLNQTGNTYTINSTGMGGTVTAVTGSGNIASSGGATPNITFTGILPLASGGTNANNTAINGGVVYSTASTFSVTPVGSAGQVLTSNGVAQPTFQTIASGWALTGNAGTVAGTNFIGTTDNINFVVKRNNKVSGLLDSAIGVTSWGVNAIPFASSGISNTAMGYYALGGNTTGYRNTAVGTNAMVGNLSGFQNVAIGERALLSNTTGNSNTAMGHDALSSNTGGTNHTAIGESALIACTGGSLNTAVGNFSSGSMINGTGNAAIGYNSLALNTAGNENTAIGSLALYGNTGSDNIGLGYQAGRYETGSNALYIHNSTNVSSEASGKTNSIIYGVMTGIPSTQPIRLNGYVGVNVAPSSSVTHLTNGFGATSATYGLQVHNSTGTNNALMVRDDGNVYANGIHNNANSPTGATNGYIASGTYTPTITDSANTSARTAYQSQWIRVGNVITVSGVADIDPTGTLTSTIVKITLPIASNFTTTGNCRGTANAEAIAAQSAAILETTAYSVSDFALMKWSATDVTNQPMSYTFTYIIQ